MFTLKLENANQNEIDINDGLKYVVLDVTGLNPPSASLFTSKSPNRKGSKYNGSTLDERNIIIKIKLLGDIEQNRNKLYDWVDTEQYTKVKFANGTKNVYCEGHIQDCDFGVFTDNEVVNLAIVCENPYLKDLQEIATEISSVLKQFTFAFAIDSAGVPFSTLKESNDTIIYNKGAETGVMLTIKMLEDINHLVIYESRDTTKRFEINTLLEKDSVVKIDTEGSPKTIKLIKPDGSVENILKYVSPNPTWFTLKKGNNFFGYSSNSGNANVELNIAFTNKYLGV